MWYIVLFIPWVPEKPLFERTIYFESKELCEAGSKEILKNLPGLKLEKDCTKEKEDKE